MKTYSAMQLKCYQTAYTLHVISDKTSTATRKEVARLFPMMPGKAIDKAVKLAQALKQRAEHKAQVDQLQNGHEVSPEAWDAAESFLNQHSAKPAQQGTPETDTSCV